MKSDKNTVQDYSRPVAYDVNGQPLYAHPPVQNSQNEKMQVVHVTRSAEPQKIEISDAVKEKHKQSKKSYPSLNLSEGEYVISAVRRHVIGLLMPISIGIFLVAISLFVIINSSDVAGAIEPIMGDSSTSFIVSSMSIFIVLVLLGIYISCYIYRNNRFFLTNESVIQEIQTGLFFKHEQTVSLMNIEDTSYYQSGILQQIFDYGTIRLSTEGDETTYMFSYVSNPKGHLATLNNAVEAFKNGRPVLND